MLFTDGRSFADTLYQDGMGMGDNFMDFYNSVCDAGTKQVYKVGVIYPPLANMFFYFLSKLLGPNLVSLPLNNRITLLSDTTGLFLFLGFLFFSIALFLRFIQQKLAGHCSCVISWLFSLALALSYPMIFCIQRGNLLLLTMVLSMFFVFFRNDNRKWVRELSLIALAIAAGFKLYPAVFGFLLIKDKEYKRAARLVVYGLLTTVAPFFFYDGIESILDLIANLNHFSGGLEFTPNYTTTDVFAYYFANFFPSDFEHYFNILHWAFFLPTTAAAVTVFFLTEDEWKRVFCLAYLFMNLNSSGQTYILIFLIIPLVLFVVDKKHSKIDSVYFTCFALLLIAIPVVYYKLIPLDRIELRGFGQYLLTPNRLVSAPVLQGMLLIVSLETIIRKITAEKSKRSKKSENNPDCNVE